MCLVRVPVSCESRVSVFDPTVISLEGVTVVQINDEADIYQPVALFYSSPVLH